MSSPFILVKNKISKITEHLKTIQRQKSDVIYTCYIYKNIIENVSFLINDRVKFQSNTVFGSFMKINHFKINQNLKIIHLYFHLNYKTNS